MTFQNKNIRIQNSHVTLTDRVNANKHRAVVIWFTGLSGSGKSSLAYALEKYLFDCGCQTFVLDGDNIRHGLCSNLGFSDDDRTENIRRVGEVSNLFMNAGMIVLAALISPFSRDRAHVRSLVGEGNFIEVYCSCPFDICQARDVKGLYKKAQIGHVPNFTGLSSPYEPPKCPEILIETDRNTLEESLGLLISYLKQHHVFTNFVGE